MTTMTERLSYKLPADLTSAVEKSLSDWQTRGNVRKLWDKDASLWTGGDEGKWLDWLNITSQQQNQIKHLQGLAQTVHTSGFSHVLLLGMGGSSLCPEVMELTFGHKPGYPQMHVLDSTDPAQVKTRQEQIDIAKTLFIVSSKSGSTLEPNIFHQYFWEQAKQVVGADEVGNHFIAITDPGSQLEQVAKRDKFRQIFHGIPGIGGRYSALSDFGMIPAASIGLDLPLFLQNTQAMVSACGPHIQAQDNPGVVLGTILGIAAKNKRDKVTLVTSAEIADLGSWLEQLLAESTGKQGHGIIPVANEELGSADLYGNDRLFVYLRLDNSATASIQDKAMVSLESDGQPVIRIAIPDIYHLGQEFFRWELATAVAGSIIGINAFNQPDVEASKVATRELTSAYERSGKLPAESPFYQEDGIELFSDEINVSRLKQAVGSNTSLAAYLKAHIDSLQPGDYLALLAYIEMNDAHQNQLQQMRHHIRNRKKTATCLGFGPRFLHSTGQAYKGGPNTGVFLQITCDDKFDLPVPQQKYTFGIVKAAQARGDFQVLTERNRRALRVHLRGSLPEALQKLQAAVNKALA